MVERRKRPTSASQYCVRGTDSLLYQREHSATRWDGALELGVNYMGKPTTAPFTKSKTFNLAVLYSPVGGLYAHRNFYKRFWQALRS